MILVLVAYLSEYVRPILPLIHLRIDRNTSWILVVSRDYQQDALVLFYILNFDYDEKKSGQ